MFLFCLVFAMFCARLFMCASWSPAGKGLTSWLSFVVSSVSLSLSHWYPGSGVVLGCIDFLIFATLLTFSIFDHILTKALPKRVFFSIFALTLTKALPKRLFFSIFALTLTKAVPKRVFFLFLTLS